MSEGDPEWAVGCVRFDCTEEAWAGDAHGHAEATNMGIQRHRPARQPGDILGLILLFSSSVLAQILARERLHKYLWRKACMDKRVSEWYWLSYRAYNSELLRKEKVS